MQSGHGKTSDWVLEYDNQANKAPEPLMGWTASDSTASQVRLHFQSAEDAVAYAEKAGIDYILQPAQNRKVKPRNYGDNFKYEPPTKEEIAAKKPKSRAAKKPAAKRTKKLEKKAQSA